MKNIRQENEITSFSESVIREISRTSMYLKIASAHVFDSFDFGLTVEQYIVLDAIYNNTTLCQRDISKIVLKDRSNICRILNILEEKALVVRKIEMKDKRPVKNVYITKKGSKLVQKIFPILKNSYIKTMDGISQEEISTLKVILKKIKHCVSKHVSVQI